VRVHEAEQAGVHERGARRRCIAEPLDRSGSIGLSQCQHRFIPTLEATSSAAGLPRTNMTALDLKSEMMPAGEI